MIETMSVMIMACVDHVHCCVGEVLPLDDDGSAERQIQSVFDFLDEPDDLNRGLEYWGANPRHSLTEHDDDDEIQEHKTTADSSDEDVSHLPPLLTPVPPNTSSDCSTDSLHAQ